ncbi:MAG: hypothetical protein MRZ54_02140 [Clostridiales bacterium]|nr:hypothetical protein [Clostridiales bacterium]
MISAWRIVCRAVGKETPAAFCFHAGGTGKKFWFFIKKEDLMLTNETLGFKIKQNYGVEIKPL